MVYVLEGELTFDGTWSTVQSCGALSVRHRISREPCPRNWPPLRSALTHDAIQKDMYRETSCWIPGLTTPLHLLAIEVEGWVGDGTGGRRPKSSDSRRLCHIVQPEGRPTAFVVGRATIGRWQFRLQFLLPRLSSTKRSGLSRARPATSGTDMPSQLCGIVGEACLPARCALCLFSQRVSGRQ